ncbi:PREDICTED: uncharacterized protein LOC104604010 isoform X2 [Nelumbo nucifera]|uniref:Uncharacterized protein LOC104604010 isoform X2 n=1 Tax=Nelumbo nucifera TaxID=4432 RepID=A0A1U8Q8L5_NELNU|nr:PREDICTED: uncharacterized protein LOC104604010 isoform X2 [Nelumbo nucifera]
MAAKPLTSEAIALTEKKMDMTLDDIIKMSKKSTSKTKKQRAPNKSQKLFSGGAAPQGNASKVRRYMDSRSSLRQGVLAQRRSNFQGDQFPLTTEAARKAAAAPIRNRAINNRNRVVNWNKPRIGARPLQRRTTEGGFSVKQQQPAKVVPKQRPQTLDSLFANMKEQRMRALSRQDNARRSGAAVQQPQQWGRGRSGNFVN